MNKTSVKQQCIKYLVIVLGVAIYAVGFQFFHFPNSIVAGGVVGVAMIINRLSGLPVGVLTIIMNIPLFIIAWRHFGLGFMISSLVGMGLSSVAVDLLSLSDFAATGDPMLAAIIGGVIKGFGLGLIYYVGATTGGVDIVAKLLRRRFAQINFGTMMLLMDVVIISLYAVILGKYDSAMYSMIGMFVVSKVVDLVLYGIDNSNLCYIISENSEDMIREILSGPMHRGVTVLEGEGAYSHREKKILMCVIKRTQIGEIRNLVRSVDEHAFFIVVDAKNVFGNGFENIAEVR